MPTELILIEAIKVIHYNGCNGVGGGFLGSTLMWAGKK